MFDLMIKYFVSKRKSKFLMILPIVSLLPVFGAFILFFYASSHKQMIFSAICMLCVMNPVYGTSMMSVYDTRTDRRSRL